MKLYHYELNLLVYSNLLYVIENFYRDKGHTSCRIPYNSYESLTYSIRLVV